jgi:hypothetical protein
MNPHFQEAMECLCTHGISETQVQIIIDRLNGMSYDKLTDKYEILHDHGDVCNCLKRTALGYPFPEPAGGRPRYLSEHDEMALPVMQMIDDSEHNLSPLPIPDVLDAACELRAHRQREAIRLFGYMGCAKLAREFQRIEIEPPSRNWINFFTEGTGLALKFVRPIDPTRLSAGCRSKISNFFEQFAPLLQSYHRELIFGCDETMIDITRFTKCVVRNPTTPICDREEKIPHITMMCAHCCGGSKVPPFVLVPKLEKESHDIEELKSAIGEAWLASSESGWQTRETFFLWAVNFAHWSTFYRARLPPCLRKSGLLLILDGHSSRQCPAALELLRAFRIEVLVLPSHCSHILQMFDIGLASSMKKLLTQYYDYATKKPDMEFPSKMASNRYKAILAGIKAWNTAASPDKCKLSAKLAGIYPFDPQRVLSGGFVTEDEVVNRRWPVRPSRNFLDINSRVITEREVIDQIRQQIQVTSRWFPLMRFDNHRPYMSELNRLLGSTQTKFPLFTSIENLTVDRSLCLEINTGSSQPMIYAQDIIDQMNRASPVTVLALSNSFEPPFNDNYLLRFPDDDPFPFVIALDSLIHESHSLRIIKVNYRPSNQVFCLKSFRAKEGSVDFENVKKYVCKLVLLAGDQWERFHGLVRNNDCYYFLQDYYKFTVETIVHMRVRLAASDWKLIMKQMLLSIACLGNIGYFYPSLRLGSFLLSEVNTVKLGGLYHAMRISEFGKFDPKYLDYCPPEFILGDRGHSQGYVVWNLGCLFFEIVSQGRKLFGWHRTNATQQVNAAIALNIARDADVFPRFWKNLPLTSVIKPVPPVLAQDDPVSSLPDDLVLQHLIRRMLAMDVNERLSVQACLNHQFFASETVETPGLGGLNLPECPSMLRFRTIWNSTGT